MQYFIIEKICKNACRLLCAGDSFERAAHFVINKVMDLDQIQVTE